eukprot:symbB.v1.2.036738.t1/scaffold5124.1/size30633/4
MQFCYFVFLSVIICGYYSDTKATREKAAGYCSQTLVAAQERFPAVITSTDSIASPPAFRSSLSGPSAQDCSSNPSGTYQDDGQCTLEMSDMQTPSQTCNGILSKLWWTLVEDCRSRLCATATEAVPTCLDMEQLGRSDHPKSTFNFEAAINIKEVPEQCKGKRKGQEGKDQEVTGAEHDSKSFHSIPFDACSSTLAYIGSCGLLDGTAYTYAYATTQHRVDRGAETRLSRRTSVRSPRSHREKFESTSKQLTKDLHSATTSLGRARKALREAQSAESAHRQAWLRHLKDATKQWEEQLDLYRRKQSQFQEAKLRASQEVEAARKLIQSLNSATAPKETATAPVEEVEDVKTGVAEAQEEEDLKRSLQTTLTACAQAAGLEMQTEEILINSDDEMELNSREFTCPHGIVNRTRPFQEVQDVEAYVDYASCAASIRWHQIASGCEIECELTTLFSQHWMAQRQAIGLRGEVALSDYDNILLATPANLAADKKSCNRKRLRGQRPSVHFRNSVELHVFEEQDQQISAAIPFGIDSLGLWEDKPWKIRKSPTGGDYFDCDKESTCLQPHVNDRWCANGWEIPFYSSNIAVNDQKPDEIIEPVPDPESPKADTANDERGRKRSGSGVQLQSEDLSLPLAHSFASAQDAADQDQVIAKFRGDSIRIEPAQEQQDRDPDARRLPPQGPAGTTRPYPWHMWEHFFNNPQEQEEHGVSLTIYGLALETIETKFAEMREPSRTQLFRTVRSMYPEYSTWNLRIHMVYPQPVDPTRRTHILAEFLPQGHDGLGNLCPVVTEVRWYQYTGLRQEMRAALYRPSPTFYLKTLNPGVCPEETSIARFGLVDCHALLTKRLHSIDFYRYGLSVTHWSSTGEIPIHFLTVDGQQHDSALSSFNTLSIDVICRRTEDIWGPQAVTTFVRDRSDITNGWYFVISGMHTDGVPLLVDRRVRDATGRTFHQLSALIWHSEQTLRQLIHDNFDASWSSDSDHRFLFVNQSPLPQDQLDQHFHPTPGTLVTVYHTAEEVTSLAFPVSYEEERDEPIEDDEQFLLQRAVNSHGQLQVEENSASGTLLSNTDECAQCRPNGDILPDPDSHVRYQFQLRNGERTTGTILAPPNWDRQPALLYAADYGTVRRDESQRLLVYVRSWFLPHDRYGSRLSKDCTIPAQLLFRLLDRLRHVWRQELLPNDTLQMRVVSPTPAALPNEYPRLHVLLECNRPRTSPRRATLLSFQDLQPDGPSPVITWIPFLAPPVLTLQIIADIAIQPCDSRHLVVLAGTPDRRWMTEQDERNVQHGLYLPVLRDIRRRFPTQRLEIDENAMMQSRDIRGSSRSPTFQYPQDLEISADSTYLAEFSADRQRQADPSDRLVLVDVGIPPCWQMLNRKKKKMTVKLQFRYYRRQQVSNMRRFPLENITQTNLSTPMSLTSGVESRFLWRMFQQAVCCSHLLISYRNQPHHTRPNAQQGTDTVVRLAWIARTDRIDDLNLELPREEAPHDAIDELKMWGITSPVHRLDLDWCAADYLVLDPVGNDIPLCIYTQGQAEISVLSCRQGPSDDDICHMSRLCTFGFERAVILHKYRVSSEIQLIHFINSATGGFEPKPPVETPAMPPQLPRRANGPVQHRIAFHNLTTSDHSISLPLSREEIVSIFGSGSNSLSTEVSHLSLTTAQIEQIECLPKHPPTSTLDSFDRLLIFVDGSSNPTHKHHDIQFVNEFGSSDAWAFAVLGERYNDKEAPLTFVGWTSQTVCYEVGAPCFTGVDRVGADVAEREALLWAGLWRISVDTNVPTTFCYDSKVAGHFAEGQFGTLNPTPQHRLLRGTFQALHSLLGQEYLQMFHVYGHRGLLWNELVDAGAKYNAHHVCYHPRQDIDLQSWGPFIPYLWIFFEGDELPRLGASGLHAPPPNLPSTVGSGPPHFPAGDDGGHHGVELWLSTTQPIGYIADEAIYADLNWNHY